MNISIRINSNYYSSFEEFAKNVYLYHNESFALIKSQKFLNILYNYNEKMYNSIVELLTNPFQPDALLFKVQYILNPLMGIKYHGYVFNDFVSLGKKILSYGPLTDIYLKDFLKYQLLSFYMEITRYDEKEPVLYEKIKVLEKEFLINENRAYFKLGFLLNGKTSIKYNGKVFLSVKEFMNYVILPVNITDFASDFIKNQYVFAWLEYLGLKKEVILFENLVSSVEHKEIENDNIRKI